MVIPSPTRAKAAILLGAALIPHPCVVGCGTSPEGPSTGATSSGSSTAGAGGALSATSSATASASTSGGGGSACAAPSGPGIVVAGATFSGGTLTLCGSGFGTKPAAAPLVWDDFESGAPGQTATQRGYQNFVGSVAVPTVSSAKAHSGAQSMKVVYPVQKTATPTDVVEQFFETGPALGNLVEVYNAFWTYWDQTAVANFQNSGGGILTNFRLLKFWRAGANDPYHGVPAAGDTIFPDASGVIGSHDEAVTVSSMPLVEVRDNGALAQPGVNSGHWTHCEYYFKLSTPGVADGAYQVWIDGSLVIDSDQVVTRAAGDQSTLTWLFMFNGGDYYQGNAYEQMIDDYYVDSTRARVVLTDSADYTSSKKWAVQPTTAWAPTSISAKATPTGFSSGETAYVHVFDSAGNRSAAGHAVTLP